MAPSGSISDRGDQTEQESGHGGVVNGAFQGDGDWKSSANGSSPHGSGAAGLEQLNAPKTWRRAVPQLLAGSAKNLILLSYGMSLGLVTIAIPALEAPAQGPTGQEPSNHTDSISLSRAQISWFGSINWIMVATGGIVSGPFATPWGRRPAMMAVNACFVVGALVFHLAESVPVLYLAQALCGLGGGLLEAPVLTYIAEITEPHLRGALSASTTSVLILGLFIEFSLGSMLPWRTVAIINMVFPVLAILSLCFVPESPHWLIVKGRVKDGERALRWLRGWASEDDPHVRAEMQLLLRTLRDPAGKKGVSAVPSLRLLLRPTFLKPFGIVVFSFFVGHWSGMTPLQTFAVSIFSEVGTPIDKYYATVLIGLVELAGTMLCVVLVYYLGKRPLAIVSTAGTGLCFLLAGTYVHFSPPEPHYSWVPLAALVASALISHVGIRTLPWVLIGEVYTTDVKGFASGASGCMGYLLGFTANKSFNFLDDNLELSGTFWLYSSVALVGSVVLYRVLPETEGYQLHEILEHFEGKRELRTKGGGKKPVAEKEKHAVKDKEKGDLDNGGEVRDKGREKWAADNPAAIAMVTELQQDRAPPPPEQVEEREGPGSASSESRL